MSSARTFAEQLLSKADIKIGGNRSWDLSVHDERVFNRVLRHGTLGLGEAYMDGWWDVEKLDEFFCKVLSAHLDREITFNATVFFSVIKAYFFNLQSNSRSKRVGEQHYDIGNDLYEAMLDKRMVYTCGYWGAPSTGSGQAAARMLDEAQEAKKFDNIISLGMFEHVGPKNYREYFKIANRCLKDDGFFLLHTIGFNLSVPAAEPWTDTYVFPGGVLPSVAEIGKDTEGLFVMEDWHNFGADYDKTLMAWFKNFDAAWPALRDRYDDRFYRMWKYYLLMCAGGFRARNLQLWQVVFSKDCVPGGYKSVR